MIYLAVTLLLICLAAVIFFALSIIDLALIGRDFTTSRKAIAGISQIIKNYKKENGIFYDLGSCRGELLLGVAKHCPNIRAFGVDNSRFRNLFSRAKSFMLNRPVNFLLGDIYKANINKADAVYIYLNQADVSSLEEKLQKELKPGAIIITNTQHLPIWPVKETVITHLNKADFEKLFVYVKE